MWAGDGGGGEGEGGGGEGDGGGGDGEGGGGEGEGGGGDGGGGDEAELEESNVVVQHELSHDRASTSMSIALYWLS